jgi:serine/threonine protein kinase
MGNSNERTEMDTFKNNYEKRAMDLGERYGKAKFYSRKNNPNEIIMTKDYWTNNLDESTSYDEMVEVRKDITHENLAKTYVHDVSQENQFFTEFYKHSTAHEYHDHNLYKEIAARKNSEDERGFSENEVWYYANAMVDMDEHLKEESLGTPHGDLQPKTLMLNEDGNVKIIDNAIVTNKDNYQKCNFNDDYFAPIAPELLDDLRVNKVNPENEFTDKAEVWAIGITSLSAATNNYPERYYDWNKKEYLRETIEEDLEGLEGQKSPEQINFIRRCLEHDPEDRWSLSEANEYLKPYKKLARRKQLNFMNRQVEQTDELGGNDFFDNEDLGHREVVVETGVKEIPMTDEIGGNDFFDDDDLVHRDVVKEDGIKVYGDNFF